MNRASTKQSAPSQGGLEEKVRSLEEFSKASLNLLEDFNLEQAKFKEAQKANLNILEDFDDEGLKLRETHRATLNILEDFDTERKNAETATEQLRVTSVSRDELVKEIAERKRAEERLEEEKANLEKVNLELDSFVYTASHDLRAPLRGLSSYATFLEEDYHDKFDEKGKDY